MKKFWVIICTVIFITNCSSNSKSGNNDVNSNLTEINADITTSYSYDELDLFEKFEIFKISLPEGKLMGNVHKFLFSKNTIGIYDEINTTVWLFDQDFKYKKSLKFQLGQGPKEFNEINDVVLSGKNSVLVLGAYKILEFDLNGNVLRKVELPVIARKFDYMPSNNLFICYLNNRNVSEDFGPYNVLIFSPEGKLVKKDLPIPKYKQELTLYQPTNFYRFEDKLHFYGYLDFNVYSIDEDLEIKKKYKYDYGIHQITEKVLAKRNKYETLKEFSDNALSGFVRIIPSILETDKYLFTNIVFQKNPGTVIYDKDEGKTFFTSEIFSGTDNKLGFFFKAAHNNQLYASADVQKLINFYENHPGLDRNELNGFKITNLDSLISASDEFSNPLIIRATVKK